MTVDIIDLTESGNGSNAKKKRIKKKRKRESKIGDEPSKKKKKLVIDLSEEYSIEDQIRYILVTNIKNSTSEESFFGHIKNKKNNFFLEVV